MLARRPTGLGLGAFMLFLRPEFGSSVADAVFELEPGAKLLGRFLAAPAAAAGLLGGG